MPDILSNEIKRFSHSTKCRDTAMLPDSGRAQALVRQNSQRFLNNAKNSKRGTPLAEVDSQKRTRERDHAEFHAGEDAVRSLCVRESFAANPCSPINQATTMAKICFMREGLTGRVHPVAEKPLAWCIETLGLQRRDWWADLETQFTIDKWLELSPFSRPRWVLIRLEEIEVSGEWKSGYYFSPMMKVDQVEKLLHDMAARDGSALHRNSS